MSEQEEFLGALEGAIGGLLGFEAIDPLLCMRALAQALRETSRRPSSVVDVVARHNELLFDVAKALMVHLAEGSAELPLSPSPGDRRFSESTWQENPLFFTVEQLYLLSASLLKDLVATSQVESTTLDKAQFAAGLITDALSPTNFLFTNPSALMRAFQTGGRSVAQGVGNFVDDLVNNGGLPKKVDTSTFELGRNLAATKGEVVFRNDLIELIQYQPTTTEVHEIPLLMGPPWINRYYIMDLSPGRSLAEWAVDHGFTTFMISYRNPDASMATTTFEDYLDQGLRSALRVVQSICGSEEVNTISACIGGTLMVTLLAEMQAAGETGIVRSATLLNSLTDHEGAGVLGRVFTDEEVVAELEGQMERQGFIEADQLSLAFDLLRANDLIFRPLISRWLMGEDPPAFDLLAWNQHATRLPAEMHSFYLRHFWIENELAHDRLILKDRRLIPSDITTDVYVVGAIDDHIVPWHCSYKTTQLLGSECRFVLTSSGHIAGIVNPPGPKVRMWINEDHPLTPEQWRAGAREVNDTWWNDWIIWLAKRSGELTSPPTIGNDHYVSLGPAPGTYVRGE